MKDRRNTRKENKRVQPRCTSGVYLSLPSTKDPCLLLRCILSQDPLPPPSSALLWPAFWVTLARVRFQPFWTTKILETSSFSRQTAPPTGPSFQLERRDPGAQKGGPVSNSFFWRLHFVRQREGEKKKKKRKKKLAETASLLRKVIVPWWRPIRKCFAREEDWALAGCWLSYNREKRKSGEVEGGDGRRWLKGKKSTRESKWGTCRAFCGPDTTGYYSSLDR